MASLYIAADQPGAGKTALCAGLVHELKRRGTSAYALKPLSDSRDRAQDTDTGMYRALLQQPEADWPFPRPKGGLTSALARKIEEAVAAATEAHEVVVVEGADGLGDEATASLVELVGGKVLAVHRYSDLGADRVAQWTGPFGDRLAGVVVNGLPRYRTHDMRSELLPALDSLGLRTLGVLPEERRLLGVSVAQVAAHLGGRFVSGQGTTDGLVEHFMVGGMGLDSGSLYFGLRQHKAVVVRGDRPDIQMAALATPTECLVLTGGIEPIEYVQLEAELEGVPIIVVPADTLSTMEALGTLQEDARFDHPAKLERLAELLREHVDLGAIFQGLGLEA